VTAALYVSVDRRITLKSLKAALEPHIGTTVDNFKVVRHYVLCSFSFCLLMSVSTAESMSCV